MLMAALETAESAASGLDPSWTLVGILFAVGVLFAIAELFIPSAGVLSLLAGTSLVAAVVVAFLMGRTQGFLTLLGVVVFSPVAVYVAIRVWPHTPIARRLILTGPSAIAKAGDLARLDPKSLEGRVGTVKTALRPAGRVVLDGRPIDCVTEGGLVDVGRKVKVLAVQGSRVVVRPVEEDGQA